MGQTPRDGKHDPCHSERWQDGPDEGESQDGANVPEEESLLHAVAGVKDDWRQQDVEKQLGVKGDFLVNDALNITNLALYFDKLNWLQDSFQKPGLFYLTLKE